MKTASLPRFDHFVAHSHTPRPAKHAPDAEPGKRVTGAQNAAPGVDRMTWKDYEADIERNLEDLHGRVHRGAYRALPSRRVYIPKPDGRQRPLAVAALEDKIVQRAVTALLSAIYEEDFLGFSYGFRPGRGAHDALDALCVGIHSKKVSFIGRRHPVVLGHRFILPPGS